MTADRPSHADRYRARAHECLEREEKASDPDAKLAWKQAAAFWLALANQADNLPAEK
jgi:hypothetical protein